MSLLSLIAGLAWLHFDKQRSNSRIFISYRREEARGDAGRLTDDLKDYFGEGQIFRDIDAIEPGVDFVEAINRAVSSCAVLLAIIGPNWLTVKDKDGHRRLDASNDFIRLEIAAALNRNIRVIPVLVGGATMPKAEELPPDLVPLARRQAYDLSDKRWEFDVGQLIETLAKILGVVKKSGRKKEQSKGWAQSKITWAVGGALAVGVVLLVAAAAIYSEFKPAIDELVMRQVLSPIAPPNVQPGIAFPQPEPTPAWRRMYYTGLDAIGNYPTVVQVFDPGWRDCQRLKRIVDALRPTFDDRIAFVVADLSTYAGEDFARKYGVGETTLVFFNATGRLLDVRRGVGTEAELRNYIERVFSATRREVR